MNVFKISFTKEEIKDFLDRIEVKKSEPSEEFLKMIVSGTLEHIPFQNITMLTNERTRPSKEMIKSDMLSGMGGLCTVRNPFLHEFLRALGFNVRFISSTMGKPDCHISLIVNINRIDWWVDQGVTKENLEIINVPQKDLSHYSKKTVDIMYRFPHGVEELEGIANRTDFDIGSHTRHQKEYDIQANVKENNDSVTKLAIQNKITNKWLIPYVIEPSAGVDRGVLAVLNEAFKIEKLEDGKERTVLALRPHLSPIKAAIIPLKRNNEELVTKALNLKKSLQSLRLGRVLLDNSGNIGKSYRRHDEIGTPMCITIDFQTLEDDSVTIRDRDSMEQIRLNISEVSSYFQNNLL